MLQWLCDQHRYSRADARQRNDQQDRRKEGVEGFNERKLENRQPTPCSIAQALPAHYKKTLCKRSETVALYSWLGRLCCLLIGSINTGTLENDSLRFAPSNRRKPTASAASLRTLHIFWLCRFPLAPSWTEQDQPSRHKEKQGDFLSLFSLHYWMGELEKSQPCEDFWAMDKPRRPNDA